MSRRFIINMQRMLLRGIAGGRLATAGAASLALRALLLLGKFLFIVALARYTSPATVGLYVLVVTMVTIAIYVVGLEIHTFTTREIVGDDLDGRAAEHVQSHLRTVGGTFLVSLPVIYGFNLYLGIADKLSFALLAAILLCETLCQELGRYLLVMMRPVASNLLQFVRGAAWMPVPVTILATTAPPHSIDTILWSWLAGAGVASAWGLWLVRAFLVIPHRYRLSWVKEAFYSARYYFVVAVLTQVQYYCDRFIVQRVLGESAVGIYSFYQSFANTMMAFVQTGVVAVLLPRLLRAVKEGDRTVERQTFRTMMLWSMALALGISGFLVVGMPFLLDQVQKTAYAGALPVFNLLLLGNLLMIAGIVVHLALYARRRDALLMKVALVIIPLGLVINMIVIPRFGILGAAATFAVIAFLELATKLRMLRLLSRQEEVG